MLDQDPALDVRTALETVGRELDPIAAFAIVRAATGNTAEIWVCDRIAGKSVIQSVRLDAGWNAGRVVAFGRAGGAGRRAAEGQPRAILAGVAATGVPAAGGNRHRRRRRRPAGHLRDGRARHRGGRRSARQRRRHRPGVAAGRARLLRRRARLGRPHHRRRPGNGRRAARSGRQRADPADVRPCSSSCAAFAPGRGRSRSSPSARAPIARASWVSPAGPTSAARRATPGRRWASPAAGSSCRWCGASPSSSPRRSG